MMSTDPKVSREWTAARDVIEQALREWYDHACMANADAILTRLAAHDPPLLVCTGDKAADAEPDPAAIAANEALAAKFRAELALTEDGKHEGTREELEQCVRMIDTYAADIFPANEQGQIHFARAMMESTADEIRAFLAKNPPLLVVAADVLDQRDKLLAACKEWLAYMDKLDRESDPDDPLAQMRREFHGKRVERTRAAVAKAEGTA